MLTEEKKAGYEKFFAAFMKAAEDERTLEEVKPLLDRIVKNEPLVKNDDFAVWLEQLAIDATKPPKDMEQRLGRLRVQAAVKLFTTAVVAVQGYRPSWATTSLNLVLALEPIMGPLPPDVLYNGLVAAFDSAPESERGRVLARHRHLLEDPAIASWLAHEKLNEVTQEISSLPPESNVVKEDRELYPSLAQHLRPLAQMDRRLVASYNAVAKVASFVTGDAAFSPLPENRESAAVSSFGDDQLSEFIGRSQEGGPVARHAHKVLMERLAAGAHFDLPEYARLACEFRFYGLEASTSEVARFAARVIADHGSAGLDVLRDLVLRKDLNLDQWDNGFVLDRIRTLDPKMAGDLGAQLRK